MWCWLDPPKARGRMAPATTRDEFIASSGITINPMRGLKKDKEEEQTKRFVLIIVRGRFS